MSDEGAGFERSTLERKDRAELAAIAEALGKKPAARAKKAAIIDLVLELAGVTETPEAGTADADADTSATAGASEASSGESSKASSGADSNGSSATASTSSKSATKTGDAPAAKKGGSSNGSESTDAADGESSTSDSTNSESSNGDASDGESDGDGESGGRRRRRRGRGRDRDDNDWEGDPIQVAGLLDLRDDGYGFLRVSGFTPSREDVYVSVKQCRQLGLRKGDHLTGTARPAARQEKNPSMSRVETVNGLDPQQARERPRFDDLTAVYPSEKLSLHHADDTADVAGRAIDIVTPIGKGQRGLIIAAPNSGRTSVLTSIASAVERNHPECQLIVLLVDERPEEVTEFRGQIEADVVASTTDRPAEEHTAIVELTVEHAKRQVEYGNDVVLVLDGLTDVARAQQLSGTGGRSVGRVDASSLHAAKHVFGAARNVEEGGSLTIIGTALSRSRSALDEMLIEELTAAANMQLQLDPIAAGLQIRPAIDLDASHTFREDLLIEGAAPDRIARLRAHLGDSDGSLSNAEMLERLFAELAKTGSNDDLHKASAS